MFAHRKCRCRKQPSQRLLALVLFLATACVAHEPRATSRSKNDPPSATELLTLAASLEDAAEVLPIEHLALCMAWRHQLAMDVPHPVILYPGGGPDLITPLLTWNPKVVIVLDRAGTLDKERFDRHLNAVLSGIYGLRSGFIPGAARKRFEQGFWEGTDIVTYGIEPFLARELRALGVRSADEVHFEQPADAHGTSPTAPFTTLRFEWTHPEEQKAVQRSIFFLKTELSYPPNDKTLSLFEQLLGELRPHGFYKKSLNVDSSWMLTNPRLQKHIDQIPRLLFSTLWLRSDIERGQQNLQTAGFEKLSPPDEILHGAVESAYHETDSFGLLRTHSWLLDGYRRTTKDTCSL